MGGIELEINNIKITEKNHQTLGNLKKTLLNNSWVNEVSVEV